MKNARTRARGGSDVQSKFMEARLPHKKWSASALLTQNILKKVFMILGMVGRGNNSTNRVRVLFLGR